MNNFIIHSSVNGHLGCFYFLATINRTVTNMDEQIISVVDIKFFGHMPKTGIDELYSRPSSSFFYFLLDILAQLMGKKGLGSAQTSQSECQAHEGSAPVREL